MSRATNRQENTQQTTQANAQQHTPGGQAESTGMTERQSDRERAIDTSREGERQGGASAGLSRRQSLAPAFGAGTLASPFALMQRMAEDMDRLFEQFGFGRSGFSLTPAFGALSGRGESRGGSSLLGRAEQSLWSPQVEMLQRGDRLVVRADVPGVSKDDLHVDVEEGVLTIRGERREEREENEEGVYRSERSYGQFYRAIPLPEGVDAERCEATYKDGVLEITLPAPKQEGRRARRIEIR